MLHFAGKLIVEDGTGARFQIGEFRGRRFFRSVREFRLETGELARRIDFDTYVTTKTGKTLSRVST